MNKSKNNSNKNSTLQSAQALSGVFCVIAFLNMTSKYLNIDSNFIISRYGSIMNFENIATEFGNKLGYSTVVLMLLFIIILCKISFIVIKKTHNQECIMYKCCPFVLLMPFLQFFVGYGIGSEILPFRTFTIWNYRIHSIVSSHNFDIIRITLYWIIWCLYYCTNQ